MSIFYGRVLILVLACLVVTALAACGSERKSEPAGEPESMMPTAKRSAAEGVEIPTEGHLPSDFPADVPLYPGAAAQQSISIPGDSLFVTFETSASLKEVHAFYLEQLENQGWRIVSDAESMKQILAVKVGSGETKTRNVTIMMIDKGSVTEVGVSVKSG